MPGQQLKVVNDLLRKTDGQYAIPIDIRVKLTHELTLEEHRELAQRVIDFCLEELKHMNALHMWQFSKEKKPSNFATKVKLDAMEVN